MCWSFIIFVVIQHLWNTCPVFRQLLRLYALYSCSKICSLDFVLIRYGKVTDMKTAAFGKKFITYDFLTEGSTSCHGGLHGELSGLVRSQKQE